VRVWNGFKWFSIGPKRGDTVMKLRVP